ncbi:unnamed protein product [Phytophthora fragariaefolia]|uniref:Unnamed protein product n=1 Tax=Phytophthora fragariaefolia TaxID=1490495 RepID=A0A9W6YBD9_9STRA|nr:unnamed protein product [Phytophthora fragariaefolia]
MVSISTTLSSSGCKTAIGAFVNLPPSDTLTAKQWSTQLVSSSTRSSLLVMLAPRPIHLGRKKNNCAFDQTLRPACSSSYSDNPPQSSEPSRGQDGESLFLCSKRQLLITGPVLASSFPTVSVRRHRPPCKALNTFEFAACTCDPPTASVAAKPNGGIDRLTARTAIACSLRRCQLTAAALAGSAPWTARATSST